MDAEKQVETVQNDMGEPSEMAQIRNLHWWTVEYGLIGTVENPKIYGAGLLSSIGESEWCMTDEVKKLPYSVDVAHKSFDITKPQPQLYVTPDFAFLSMVLNEFANSMSVRKGGLRSIKKLIKSESIGTIELSTGIQISGVFSNVIEEDGKAIYVQTIGQTALAYREKELIGHGVEYHAAGYGTAIGKLKGINLAIEDMSPRDLEAYGLYEGKSITLNFEGGIRVVGEIITGQRNLKGEIILISFKNCTVTYHEKILFRPEWGTYDMAVGVEITSAFSGPASLISFEDTSKVSEEKTIKIQYSDDEKELFSLYQKVRVTREEKILNTDVLESVFKELQSRFPQDWLLPLEIYELAYNSNSELEMNVLNHLEKLSKNKKLIHNGLKLIQK